MLRDRLTCGINDDKIQNRLLAESKLDFKKAMEIALSIKEASKRAKELKPATSHSAEVHKVHASVTGKTEGIVCHRCGGKGHKAPTCRFKTTKCHNSGKIGHLKRVCRSKGKPINASGKSPSRPVHCITESEQEQGEEYHLFNIGSGNGSPPVKVEVMVDNKPICMEIDTGVGPSLVSEATFKELFPNRDLLPSPIRLRTYSGEPINVLGSFTADVQYKRQQAQLPLLVVQCAGPSLLGRSWLQCLQLDWQEFPLITA